MLKVPMRLIGVAASLASSDQRRFAVRTAMLALCALPFLESAAHAELASYYGQEFAGRLTASGERFNPNAMAAAHRTLRFGTRVRVTNSRNGRSVIVRIDDRGPFVKSRAIDQPWGCSGNRDGQLSSRPYSGNPVKSPPRQAFKLLRVAGSSTCT